VSLKNLFLPLETLACAAYGHGLSSRPVGLHLRVKKKCTHNGILTFRHYSIWFRGGIIRFDIYLVGCIIDGLIHQLSSIRGKITNFGMYLAGQVIDHLLPVYDRLHISNFIM
jgi:hypothetical protein